MAAAQGLLSVSDSSWEVRLWAVVWLTWTATNTLGRCIPQLTAAGVPLHTRPTVVPHLRVRLARHVLRQDVVGLWLGRTVDYPVIGRRRPSPTETPIIINPAVHLTAAAHVEVGPAKRRGRRHPGSKSTKRITKPRARDVWWGVYWLHQSPLKRLRG